MSETLQLKDVEVGIDSIMGFSVTSNKEGIITLMDGDGRIIVIRNEGREAIRKIGDSEKPISNPQSHIDVLIANQVKALEAKQA